MVCGKNCDCQVKNKRFIVYVAQAICEINKNNYYDYNYMRFL